MDTVAETSSPDPSKIVEPVQADKESAHLDDTTFPEEERKVTFDIPHHYPTRLSDIDEEGEFESRLDHFVTQESESKWRCKVPRCTKLFKGHHFWRRHAFKRHLDLVAELENQALAHGGVKTDFGNQVLSTEETFAEDHLPQQVSPETPGNGNDKNTDNDNNDNDNDNDNDHDHDDKDETSSCGSWQPLVKPSDRDVRVLDDDTDDESDEGECERVIRRLKDSDWDEFFEAAKKGDIETLKEKLEKGCKTIARNITGSTPLVAAIMEQQVEAVKLLLEHGADANDRVHTLPPLCHAACQTKNEVEMMELLLEHGAILTAISQTAKKNVLHWAVSEGRNDAVEFLLNKKMDIEKTCPQLRTPLILAAEKGHKETAELLLKHGADIAAKSNNGGGVLMWSACHNHPDMIDFWLDKGLDVNSTDKNGNTALLLASHFGYLKVVEKLVEHGADHTISSDNPPKFTALMAAACANHSKLVDFLLKSGSDHTVRSGAGSTALEIALIERKTEAVHALLEVIDPSCPKESVGLQIAMSHSHQMMQSLMSVTSLMYPHISSKDETPGEFAWLEWVLKQGGKPVKSRALTNLMHAALEDEKIDFVKALVSQGCDVNIKLDSGHSPLSWAVSLRNIDLIKALLELGADPNQPITWSPMDQTPFDSAVICMKDGHDTEIVDLLLATGRCKINIGKDPQATPFSFVLSMSKIWEFGLAEVLGIRMLDSIKDVNDDRDSVGGTLLHAAVYRESEEFIDLLIKRGADIEAKDSFDATPFIVACQRSAKMMEVMIKHGADTKTKYKGNTTGLLAAVSYGKLECVKKAVELGIDLEETTEIGMTALGCALNRRYEDVSLYLIKKGAKVHWKAKDTNITTLHLAARYRMYRVVPLLIKENVDVNSRCSEGWTPLHEAAAVGATPMVINLLEAGADIEAAICNKDRTLHLALVNRHPITARVLIDRGADITARGDKNRTMLHLSASYGLPTITSYLLEKGLSTEDTDDESWTPLCCCSNLETLKILMAAGANINYADRDGWTPLHQTFSAVEEDCAEALLAAGADVDCRTTDDGMNIRERAEGLEKRDSDIMLDVLYVGTRRKMAGKRFGRESGFIDVDARVDLDEEFDIASERRNVYDIEEIERIGEGGERVLDKAEEKILEREKEMKVAFQEEEQMFTNREEVKDGDAEKGEEEEKKKKKKEEEEVVVVDMVDKVTGDIKNDTETAKETESGKETATTKETEMIQDEAKDAKD
ncbi:ankyrin repeat-containing domain protein [Dendryphion nanum]|uniref:Ankyrin repeat-containing domain protein n=1 Tax=Dendryphion nanum TaxID=256645 RepID=A0A9P9D809_9PLEO|nr:ankyrin repeat-containing domain protein [Dendryphion nanum]